ncbi:MAG: SPFH domain-containing protein, partial [Pseudomonadota bacterium]
PEFGPIRLRAFGTYTIRVSDPARFMTEIVGTDGEFTTDEISFQIRNVIVQEFSRAIASSGLPVLDMAANTGDVGKLIAEAISPTLESYGLTVPEFYIENISLPPAVEKALDERSSRGIAGNLDDHLKWKAAQSMGQGGAAGDAMGMGLGAALGMQMAGQMGQHPAPVAAPAPPPPPVEHVWHIAENGATKGPFSKAQLAEMAGNGSLSRETFVWTQGQDGWRKAEDVTELAQLFTIMPPPPPPGV